MKHKYKTIAAATMLLYLFAGAGLRAQQAPSGSSDAQSAPRTLSYQGVLITTGTNGTKATGSRLLTVTLYSDANGNNKIWQSTMNTTVDTTGVFNCTLGTAENPLPAPSAMDRPIWLGVAISGGVELRPLSQVTASAYALNVVDNAITTVKLADSAVTSVKLANGSVTWNKMGTEYVPYIRVNGAKVNTGQNSINFTGSEGLKVDYDSNTMSVIVRPDSSAEINTGSKGARPQTVVAGMGSGNTSFGTLDFIGGGLGNTITSVAGTPRHGLINTITAGDSNFIGGLTADHNFIGGGKTNKINSADDTNGDEGSISYNVIGGGHLNGISIGDPENDSSNTIGGGTENTIGGDPAVNDCFIGGGNGNYITSSSSTVTNATIGGGNGNEVFIDGATIGGGVYNINSGQNSFIGGGYQNSVYGTGVAADIPGGYNLTATEFAQTIIGESNIIQTGTPYGNLFMQGTFSAWPIVAGSPQDEPIFVIGNGPSSPTVFFSDAFQVTYDGHSIVYDQLGSHSTTRPAVFGGTYNDNIIYAWGDINANGTEASDFGVSLIIHAGPGTYAVLLNNSNTSFTNASVTVTIRETDTTNLNGHLRLNPGTAIDHECGRGEASEIGIFTAPNAFLIHTYPAAGCSPVDMPFFFKVCGR